MTTYIKDLISLPERVHRGDFVLKLADGISPEQAERTLRDYVVTQQLVGAFDNALAFIRSAVDSHSSKAAYLHGSFGSGKSHFMAVLYLLLHGNAQARSVPELAGVVRDHGGWMEGRRFLLVPYHMLGALSMEQAIFGQYVEYVRRLHPEAPTPGVYLAGPLFANANELRQTMGDETFFARLNSVRGAGWGTIEARWDRTSFDRAVAAGPGSEDRTRLISDLVDTLLPAFRDVARTRGDDAFVSLDEGLSVLSRHAASLGYQGLVLFLDELVLWLASHAADMAFITREGQKLAKLVEAQLANRPAPIVSFVARQRDLRDLIGHHVPGAEQLAFADVLRYHDGRFHVITLEDRNLPAIVERRVLKPVSDDAQRQFDAAFVETARVREEVMDALLTSTADRAMFRQVYPFTPALVQTLVALSSLLQRERTAIKVMIQLLVQQRECLRLGDLVPVGDLFDVIAEGDEAFSEGMRQHFDNAKRLYLSKLRPLLLQAHKLSEEQARERPPDDPQVTGFRADDRLVKTLLLSALAPEVEALKSLTPGRLAALNHGSIRSPIPGREGQLVLRKAREWAAQAGEVRISDEGANPTISVQLSGVDVDSILERARAEDNQGNRRRKVKELLFRELGIEDLDRLFSQIEFVWRGTKRQAEVAYDNVREMASEVLRSRDEQWRVVIDFPFDVEGRTPNDDLAQIEQYRGTQPPSNTIAWIPSFLSRDAQKDLGTLVILDHVLAGERFATYATHLSAVDRAAARSLLESRRSQLTHKMKAVLEGAYGVSTALPGTIDASHELGEKFQTLDAGFTLQPPVGATLREALLHLLDQALSHQYPAHPRFEGDVKIGALRRVFAEIQRAAQDPDGRIFVEPGPARQAMRQIAYPLQLGEMGETHFVLGRSWVQHFGRKTAQEPGVLTVRKLRAWIDEPAPRGLLTEVENLVILAYAEQTNLRFTLHGGPASPSIESVADELELHEIALPAPEQWTTARQRASSIFGLVLPELRSATNVAEAVKALREQAAGKRDAAASLATKLRDLHAAFGLTFEATNRGRTAVAVHDLVLALERARPEETVQALAGAGVATSESAMGSSLQKAADLLARIGQTRWEIIEAAFKVQDERRTQADALRKQLIEALASDEYAVGLGARLVQIESDAVKLLTERPTPLPTPPPTTTRGWTVVDHGERQGLTAREATDTLDAIRKTLGGHPLRRLSISWKVEEETER